MAAHKSLGVTRRTQIEQAIARREKPSVIMAHFGLDYAEYRDVWDAMVDGYDHVHEQLVAKRAAGSRKLLRDLEREARIVAENAQRYRSQRRAAA